VALQERPDVHVLVPLGHAEGEVAERVRSNVDSACEEAVALLGREPPVVADDVRDRVGHFAPFSLSVRQCHEVESSEAREHPVEVGSLQLEEPWTWGIAGELESGARCFLTFEDEYIQGRARDEKAATKARMLVGRGERGDLRLVGDAASVSAYLDIVQNLTSAVGRGLEADDRVFVIDGRSRFIQTVNRQHERILADQEALMPGPEFHAKFANLVVVADDVYRSAFPGQKRDTD
jgi:hypothetical protein